MATSKKERLDRLSDAHNKTGITSAEPATIEETPADEQPEIDFNDPVTQERILHPEGTEVTLSYGTIRLYPPSAMVRRLAYAFCQELLADAAETHPTSANVFSMRLLSKIMATAAPQLRLFRLVASICGKPGTIDDKTALNLSTEIAENASPDDVAELFGQITVASGIKFGGEPSAKK